MLWICSDCTAASAVGVPRCPQCGGVSYTEDGAMPRIHKDRPPSGLFPTPPLPEPPAPEPVPEPPAVEPPAPVLPDETARKTEWAQHLVEQGHDPAYVRGLTKAEMIGLAGTSRTTSAAGHAEAAGGAGDIG